MAGAAYLQAKAEAVVSKERSPGKSAAVTGVSYLASVVALALPYFLTRSMSLAFSVTLLMAIAIVSSFTFYNAVLNESEMKKELAENMAILFGTTMVAFLFGDVVGKVFHITSII
jgi:VIT1/CCC1 family predicted Fe2+/Mn2+ transporter